jgi:hypothetical protein
MSAANGRRNFPSGVPESAGKHSIPCNLFDSLLNSDYEYGGAEVDRASFHVRSNQFRVFSRIAIAELFVDGAHSGTHAGE